MEYARKCIRTAYFGVKNNFVLLGLFVLGLDIIAPLLAILQVFNEKVHSAESIPDMMNQSITFISGFSALLAGIIIPLMLFGFVYSRRQSDFYNSMPIKRGQYFIGYSISGLFIFTVPYIITRIIFVLFCSVAGVQNVSLFSGMWQAILVYIIVYASMTFAIMFSGSGLSAILTLALMNVFTFVLLFGAINLGWRALDSSAYDSLAFSVSYSFMPLSSAYFLTVNDFAYLPAYLILTAAELVLAFVMYRYRKGETTLAVAFPKTRYILQYMIMFVTAFIATCKSFYYDNFQNIWSNIILSAIIIVVLFVVLNMLLEKDFRAAFHKIRYLFIFAAGYVVVVAGIYFVVNNCLPYYITPIQTDAVRVEIIRSVYSEDVIAGDARKHEEWTDENGDECRYVRDRMETFYITDPEQVRYVRDYVYKYMNRPSVTDEWQDLQNCVEEHKPYYYMHIVLLDLKDGITLDKDMSMAYRESSVMDSYYCSINYITDTQDIRYFHDVCRDFTWRNEVFNEDGSSRIVFDEFEY